MSSSVRKGRRKNSAGRTSPVVRRAFSMQEADAKLIEALRVRCAAQGILMNQSEVVRVGLHVLADMNDGDLKGWAARLERLAVVRSKASK
jgi:hypothetical protein